MVRMGFFVVLLQAMMDVCMIYLGWENMSNADNICGVSGFATTFGSVIHLESANPKLPWRLPPVWLVTHQLVIIDARSSTPDLTDTRR